MVKRFLDYVRPLKQACNKGLQLLFGHICHIVTVNAEDKVIVALDLLGAQYFVYPAPDAVTYHRGLINLTGNNYRRPEAAAPGVKRILKRHLGVTHGGAATVCPVKRTVSVKTVVAPEHG